MFYFCYFVLKIKNFNFSSHIFIDCKFLIHGKYRELKKNSRKIDVNINKGIGNAFANITGIYCVWLGLSSPNDNLIHSMPLLLPLNQKDTQIKIALLNQLIFGILIDSINGIYWKYWFSFLWCHLKFTFTRYQVKKKTLKSVFCKKH